MHTLSHDTPVPIHRARPAGAGSTDARRRRTARMVAAGAVLAAALAAAGCGRLPGASAAQTVDGQAHGPAPAATFKDGRGLQLSPAAAQLVGLREADVVARDLPGAPGTAAIPKAALVRTARGDFVYVANGGWYLRTPVAVTAGGGDWIAVTEGLYEGDVVVASGARDLWLAEIQAVNGGVSCTDGH